MVVFKTGGDLLAEETEALVNTVNCVGVMGRGVALQFKNRFPENFKRYVAACKRGDVVPGKMFIFNHGDMFGVKWIVNFPTKRHWRMGSLLSDIEAGLDALAIDIKRLNIKSIAIPPLGCGLGGLDWRVVKQLIVQKLAPLTDVDIRVFEPNDAIPHGTICPTPPNMTIGRAALLVLCDRYIRTAMVDFDFTLLAMQKLMYLMQEDGLDLRLNYVKAPAGPYAKNLGNVLTRIEGYFITGYNDGGDSPIKVLSLVENAVRLAESYLPNVDGAVMRHVDRVLELIGRNCDSSYLELLASVHWLYHCENAISADDVFNKLQAWNSRKQRFSRPQVELAYGRLLECGWFERKRMPGSD